MISQINEWFGRTGNNVIQIINCIYYSFYMNNFEKIVFPRHGLFHTNIILNKEEKENKVINTNDKTMINNFFYAKKLGFTLEPYQMREIAQKYILDIIKLNISNHTDSTKEQELYIHIRGGDTLNNGVMLLQNPLKLYTDILNNKKYDIYKKINIIYEDTNNPVVSALYKLQNPRLQFQSSDIITDIETLCKAENLLMSLSTFSLLIYFLSKNIKHILLPDFMAEEWYPNLSWNIKKTIFTLENYSISIWKNLHTHQKKKLLLYYQGKIEV